MSFPIVLVGPIRQLEVIVLLLAVVVWLAFPKFGRPVLGWISRGLYVLSRRPRLAWVVVGAVAFAGAAATALVMGIPVPAVHDEFSYLLAAKTFVSGHLAGTASPFWEHFETFHVLQQPVHASKYPVGQGLLLAIGMLFGHPIVGVWLSAFLACAAITWMLQAWLPPRWAVGGGLLAALNFGCFSDWSQSYWGGLLAACGGALFFGAVRRLADRPAWSSGALLGLGALILANTRPFEGAVTVALTGLAFLGLKPRPAWLGRPKQWAPALLCAGGVLAAGALPMAYYNWNLTGSPLKMPYTVYEKQYSFAPLFLFFDPKPPAAPYRNAAFEEFREQTVSEHTQKRTQAGFFESKIPEAFFTWFTYGRTILFVPFVIALLRSRTYWIRVAAFVTNCLFLILLVETWSGSRKFAPVTCLVVLLITIGLRRVRAGFRAGREKRRPILRGPVLFRAIVVSAIAACTVGFTGNFILRQSGGIRERPRIEAELKQQPGRDLVIVQYSEQHSPHDEWVYNEPEIETAEVVWARDLGDSKNCALIRHFAGRRIWVLAPDFDPPAIGPLSADCSELARR